MSSFLVYKSSAGSGKTYTLMVEYLSLVLKNPGKYSRILAITFTNKAAYEIKQRILENLKFLASLNSEELPDRKVELVERLIKATSLTKNELVDNAGKVLASLLHNYSDFAVSTIDSFMHRVIRSFAFDLKLSMNFEVELDIDSLINTAVDELISKVGKDPELTSLLKNYVINKAENDESWDITQDLRNSTSSLFKEKMAGLIPVLNEKEFSSEEYKKVCAIQSSLKEECKALGSKAVDQIYETGLELSDFKSNKNGIGYFFYKLSNGQMPNLTKTVRNAYIEDEWFAKNNDKSNSFEPIKESLKQYCNAIEKLYPEVKLLTIVKKNFHTTLLLKRINEELNNIRLQRNLIPISDFNNLISEVVKEQPVPFIYLRVGEKYKHFMIDEFQDTSCLQWENLLPLIENSLSQANLNLIVGDGKQAIYRFKNGDAEQFINLPMLHNPEGSRLVYQREKLLDSHYVEKHLKVNYRSRREIVEFNNDFFTFAAPLFIPTNIPFYADVKQDFQTDNIGGLIEFAFTDKDNSILKIIEIVAKAKDDGYSYGDIAILTRANKDASRIAEALQEEGIKVVSSESLLLTSCPEVNFLINWIAIIANPNDLISMQGILEYLHWSDYQLRRRETAAGQLNLSDFYALIEEAGIKINHRIFEYLSLYDSVELLIRQFNLNILSPIYLRFFLDVVLDFTQRNSSGATAFTEFWHQKKSGLSISIAGEKDAVQLLTVHKSKGLAFPVVIYAFPDPQNNHADLTWNKVKFLNTNLSEDNEVIELPLVYKYGTELEGTLLEEDYNNEKSKICLDKLNLYYVAFTRASERLYVVLKENTEPNTPPKSLSDLIILYLEKHNGARTFGSGSVVEGRFKNTTHEIVNYKEMSIDVSYTAGNWRNKISLAKRAPAIWNSSLAEKTAYGKLVHMLLSKIDNLEELKAVAENYFTDDSDSEIIMRNIENFIHELEGFKETSLIFNGGSVIKEQEILTPEGKIYRPDRVVIKDDTTYVVDFKTGEYNEKHLKQIELYVNLLCQMGYSNPVGYLLYLGEKTQYIKIGREVKV